VFQGAARRLVPAVDAPRPPHAASSGVFEPTGAASFVTELRRQTTAILKGALSEERLHRLRAEGQAMDDDHVVACTLEAIERAAREPTR